MNKKLPQQLSEKQELLRQQTINSVLHAITDIQAGGETVTIAALVEFTGLSRSVFAKPHIRELLTKYGYGNDKAAATKQHRKAKKQAEILFEKDNRILHLQAENTALMRECELLRGRLLMLMQQAQYK